jgi:CHASE1-domain containing sensor protein
LNPTIDVPSSPVPSAHRFGHLAVVATVVFGVIASIAVFLLIEWSENRLAEITFQNQARDHLRIIAVDFNDSSNLLYTLRAYIQSADHPITRAEFTRFSETLHREVVSLRDTGWAPRVTSAERAAFERTVQA